MSAEKGFFKKWSTVVITALSLFIIIIDTTILNVSLSDVSKDLNTDLPTLQWAITIYALVMGALLITGGKLGDVYGRKKIFRLGMLIYGIGTTVAALSTNAMTLIIGWSVLEGIGGAMMMPATQSLLTENYKGRDRALAMGIWGGIAGAAAAFGPIFGGWLTTDYSWRWAFALEILVVIAVLILSRKIPVSKSLEKDSRLDIVGVFLSSIGITSLVYGIIESTNYGWWQAKKVWEFFGYQVDLGYLSIVPVFVTIGLALIGTFIWWLKKEQDEGRESLFDLKIFKSKQFSSAVVVVSLMALSQSGMMFTLAPLLQGVREYDAFQTGIAFLPMSLSMMFVAPLAAKLSKYVKSKHIIQLGLITSIVASFVIRSQISLEVEGKDLAVGMFLTGVGMGLVMSQVMNMVMSSVQKDEVGQASGVNSTIRQVGTALGTAIIGTVLLTVMTNTFTDGVENSKVIPEQVKTAMVNKIQNEGVRSSEFSQEMGQMAQTNPKLAQEIKLISNTATVEADKETYYYTAGFYFLSLIATIWLPMSVKASKE